MRLRAFSTGFALLVVACGGSQPPAEAPAPAPEVAAPAPEAPASTVAPAASSEAPTPEAFDDMSRDQRKAFMKSTVLPKARELFQAWDAQRFAKFDCGTCHGAGAKDGTFKMPNPELPKLPNTPEGFKALAQKKPAAVKFMSETLKPTMAELLHQQPFDPKTGKGFGCGECHTMGG